MPDVVWTLQVSARQALLTLCLYILACLLLVCTQHSWAARCAPDLRALGAEAEPHPDASNSNPARSYE